MYIIYIYNVYIYIMCVVGLELAGWAAWNRPDGPDGRSRPYVRPQAEHLTGAGRSRTRAAVVTAGRRHWRPSAARAGSRTGRADGPGGRAGRTGRADGPGGRVCVSTWPRRPGGRGGGEEGERGWGDRASFRQGLLWLLTSGLWYSVVTSATAFAVDEHGLPHPPHIHTRTHAHPITHTHAHTHTRTS